MLIKLLYKKHIINCLCVHLFSKFFLFFLVFFRSLKYHPDKNPNAKDHYINIQKAYSVLIDESKRSEYDSVYQAKKQREEAEKLMNENVKRLRNKV